MVKLIIFTFLILSSVVMQGQTTISGTISDKSSGETIPFATVAISNSTIGVVSNNYGFYSLNIPSKYIVDNKVSLICSFVGYEKQNIKIDITKDLNLDINLVPSLTKLKEVEIKAEYTKETEQIRSSNMSTTTIQAKTVKHLPTIAGEQDLVKVMQLLPGVSGGTEGGTSLFVRGGDADQNLVLLDEATVYNVGHLFGFFSVFNSDAISDLTMTKGGFGANYGGRLSSILDVRMKEGNANKFHGSGGIGLLSSRLMLEGPIIKDKMSFLISGRRTYIDKVFSLVGTSLPYYFYDINAKVNYKLSKNDRLFYSFYMGRDVLKINEDVSDSKDSSKQDLGLNFGFTLGNTTNTLRWNHIYNSKLFSNISFIATNFDYRISGHFDNNNLQINSKIFDLGVKADYDYFKDNFNHIKFGASYILHNFRPNIVNTSGDIETVLHSQSGTDMLTHEFAVYALNDWDLSKKIRINYGLRISAARVVGKTYAGLEPRIATRYLLNKNNSFKMSYSRMKQYMHRVASSSIALPTDLWYPITANIKPQIADQVALGYNHLFIAKDISLEFELYYKKMQNLIEYREGANLILNNNYESELLAGKGTSYGAEILLRKQSGIFNGWVSYTLSRSVRDFNELNKGATFPAKYDRRHNFSLVVNIEASKRWIFSAVWVYQSGSRFTAQIGQYFMPNSTMTGVEVVPIYTSRNAVELSPSHRLDVNVTFKSKPHKRFKGEWSLGAYNYYNRAQPYRVNIVPNKDGIGYHYQQPGLFGFIPSIAYNFSF